MTILEDILRRCPSSTILIRLTFNKAERRYSTYKCELAILVRFAIKYQHFFRNADVDIVIHTDHKPLTWFLKLPLGGA